MNTKTNKKSLLAILISSALALMLSVATLFTLPTFSASADAGQQSMTFNDVIQETEIITDGQLNGNNYFRAYYEEGTQTVSFEYGAYVLTCMDGVWTLTNDGANVNITNMDVFNTISYGSYVDFYLPYMESVTNNECDCMSFYRIPHRDNGVYQLSLKDYTVKATADTEVITNRLIRVRRADNQPLYTEGDNFYFDGLSIGGGERLYISVREDKVCINNYENDTVIALHRFEDNFMTYVDFYLNSEHYNGATLTHGHSSFNGDEYIFEELFLDVEEETNDGAEEEKDDFWQNVKDTVNGWGNKGSEWLYDNLNVTIAGSSLVTLVLVVAVVVILARRRK